MRTIKFRAWDKEHGMSASFNVWDAGKMLQALLLTYTVNEMPELMQFTGLTDKNGKEIYEGDIVKTSEDFIGMVEFNEGEYLVRLPYEDVGEYKKPEDLSDWYESLLEPEVLGNIYENPELLIINQ